MGYLPLYRAHMFKQSGIVVLYTPGYGITKASSRLIRAISVSICAWNNVDSSEQNYRKDFVE